MGEQLSYWQLIVDASIIVKLVMLVLLGLSTLTWVFIFERRSVINDSFKNLPPSKSGFGRALIWPTYIAR